MIGMSSRFFSASNDKNEETTIEQVAPESNMTLEELMSMVDMEALKQFNPKLHAQIAQDPQ